MVIGPVDELLHGLQKRTPQIGQGVFHPWGDFRVKRAGNEAVLLELLERARQHLSGNIADLAHQGVKAQGARGQRFQNQQAPLIANPVEHITNGAGLVEHERFAIRHYCHDFSINSVVHGA